MSAFLFKIKEKKIPLILLNARITKKTLNRWKIFSKFAEKIFNNFNLCLASSEESKKNLQILGVKNISYIGNLKFCSKTKFGCQTSKKAFTKKCVSNGK